MVITTLVAFGAFYLRVIYLWLEKDYKSKFYTKTVLPETEEKTNTADMLVAHLLLGKKKHDEQKNVESEIFYKKFVEKKSGVWVRKMIDFRQNVSYIWFK